ncbi:MAG TPA: MFS transporter, partial [Stellaceae bacterium]|nr:MFS transporter [Stellaceae bacterium]
DYFPKAHRGAAVGVYGIGGFGGIGLSYIIGGAVLASFRGVDTVALPVVGETSLWHAAFIIVGLITLALAMLMFTVREPERHLDRQQTATGGGIGMGRHFREHWGAFCVLIAGYTCLGFNSIGWFAWLPTYFIREFHMAPASAGAQVGWVTTIGGVAGAVVGGYIADWMARRGFRGGKLPTLALMFLLWIPCALCLWLFDSPALSLACAFVFTFADGIGYMQAANVIQEAFPAHLRARSIAAWMVCSAVFSYGWGPIVFGYTTDHLFGGGAGLRYSLGIVSLPVMLLGLALAWAGRKAYDRTRIAADPTAQVDIEWLAGRPLAAPAQT